MASSNPSGATSQKAASCRAFLMRLGNKEDISVAMPKGRLGPGRIYALFCEQVGIGHVVRVFGIESCIYIIKSDRGGRGS